MQTMVMQPGRPVISTMATSSQPLDQPHTTVKQPWWARNALVAAFLRKYRDRSKRIDVLARLVFPTGFFVFNCIYWTVYLV